MAAFVLVILAGGKNGKWIKTNLIDQKLQVLLSKLLTGKMALSWLLDDCKINTSFVILRILIILFIDIYNCGVYLWFYLYSL